MSVKRRDIINHFKKYGFYLKREGGNHSIFVNDEGRRVPIGRHKFFDRIKANMLCKEAKIPAIF